MNALPLADHSYATSVQSVLPIANQRTSSLSSKGSPLATDHAPEHPAFLDTLRSQFADPDTRSSVAQPAQSSNATSSSSPIPPKQLASTQDSARQGASPLGTSPQGTSPQIIRLPGNLGSALFRADVARPEAKLLQSVAEQPTAPLLENEPKAALAAEPQPASLKPEEDTLDVPQPPAPPPGLTPVQAKTADPNAQSATAPDTGAQSEQTSDAQAVAGNGRPRTQQKPLEDTALLSATRARKADEQQDEPEGTNAAQTSIAQSLDHAAALISDLASVAAPAPVSEPAKTPDERPAAKAALNATAGIEAPDSALPAVNPVLGNLAFALRLNTNTNNDAPSQLGLQNTTFSQNSGSSLSNAGSAAPAAPAPQQKLESQFQNLLAQQPVTDHTSAQPPADVHAPEAPAPTHASDFESELEKFRAAEPVRGAHVQISGTDSQRVDIRLVERAGALSLTVRSADNTLARTLQDHASELNTRLNLEHYGTELWTPSASNTSAMRDPSAGDQQNHAASYSSDSNPNQKQQQNSRQQSQPDWIDELENNSKAFQKRIEYTWS